MLTLALVVDQLTVMLGGRRILDGLTLAAQPGRLTAVLGPNGAGKTTLIRCCTGLLKPDAGSVTVLGQPAGNAQVAARVGLMPQSTGAWSGIKAVELLHYLAGLYAPSPALARGAAAGRQPGGAAEGPARTGVSR